jgi:hypothetical protein
VSAGAFCISASADFPRRSLPHSAPRQGIPVLRKEKFMSKTCGDTARFHRLRKQKINRRAKNRILQAEIAARKAEKAAKPVA